MFINRMLVLATCLLSIATQAQEKPRLVTVSGLATITIAPNQVEVNFDLHTFDKELKKSKELNDEQGRAVLEMMKSLGVEDRNIQTDSMRASAVYEELSENGRYRQGELKGYTTNRSYCVLLKDVNKFASLTDALLVNPAVSLSTYTFQHSEMRKYRDDARRKAIQAAKEKATLLAGELDCGLGMAREITEPKPYTRGRGYALYSNTLAEEKVATRDNESPTRLGEIEINAEVIVSFDLLPK